MKRAISSIDSTSPAPFSVSRAAAVQDFKSLVIRTCLNPTFTPQQFYEQILVGAGVRNPNVKLSLGQSEQKLMKVYVAKWSKYQEKRREELVEVDRYLEEFVTEAEAEDAQSQVKAKKGKTTSTTPTGTGRDTRYLRRSETTQNGNGIGIGSDKKKKKETVLEDYPLEPFVSSVIERSALEKVFLALQSPLQSEQDFGINSCLILSYKTVPGIKTPTELEPEVVLQFKDCPAVLDFLLAHTGVFNHCNLRELFTVYGKMNKIDYSTYWSRLLSQAGIHIKRLQCELFSINFGLDSCTCGDRHLKLKKDWRRMRLHREKLLGNVINEQTSGNGGGLPEVQEHLRAGSGCCLSCICSDLTSNNGFAEEDGETDYNCFAEVQDSSEFKTPTADRFFTISCILKNASFAGKNAKFMANYVTLRRYILLGLHVNERTIYKNVLQLLVNLSPFIKLAECSCDAISKWLVKFVQDGVHSEDRFVVINCVQILDGWFSQICNHNLLEILLEIRAFDKLADLISIQDMHLLLCTLKCICTATSKSRRICDIFASSYGFIKTIVIFLTFDARSYGPASLIGVRFIQKNALREELSLPSTPVPIPSDNQKQKAHVEALPVPSSVNKILVPAVPFNGVPNPMEEFLKSQMMFRKTTDADARLQGADVLGCFQMRDFIAQKLQYSAPTNLPPLDEAVRLFAAQILKDIFMNSDIGKRKISVEYEGHILSAVVQSSFENAKVLSYILHELTDQKS